MKLMTGGFTIDTIPYVSTVSMVSRPLIGCHDDVSSMRRQRIFLCVKAVVCESSGACGGKMEFTFDVRGVVPDAITRVSRDQLPGGGGGGLSESSK